MQAISEHVHVNSSYLSRLYKKVTDETVTETITRHRIKKAKELLANKDVKISEIANMIAVDEPAYFSLLFKKYTGLSPKEYRMTIMG